MKTQTSLLAAAVVILVLGSVGYAFFSSQNTIKPSTPVQNIASYEQCVQAGYPVLRSHPSQCVAGAQTFTEEVTAPVVTPSAPPEPAPVTATTTASAESMIMVTSPLPNTKIKSPLQITGSARGTWFFEASFPIMLVDANGKTIAQSPAKATGEWMTTEFVPFTDTLTWSKNTATSGMLILKRDNPSGLPENDSEIRIPVTF